MTYDHPRSQIQNRIACLVLLVASIAPSSNSSHADDQASSANPQEIQQMISQAGKAYKSGDKLVAAKLVNESNQKIQQWIAEGPDKKTMGGLRQAHTALMKAHQFIQKEGVAVDKLPSWNELMKLAEQAPKNDGKSSDLVGSEKAKPNGADFITQVAPTLVSKCGQCHIQSNKGGFSMASLEAMMKGSKGGVVLFPGDSRSSRIIETIEAGDMPRGGAKVSESELNALKSWIDEGAKFDRKIVSVPLVQLVSKDGSSPAAKTDMQMETANANESAMIMKPTGKETVSFAKDIAPILMANCNGCHIDAMQRRGGLSMDNFASLLKGGDSGAIVVSKRANDSLMVKKIKGTSGQRMPAGGRPALKDDQIALIEKWITEGASFDGHSPDAPIASVASRAWADSATPEEMMAKRKERALQKWQTAFGKNTPSESANDQFVIMGDVGEKAVEELLQSASVANEKVQRALKLSNAQPLAKGGVTIFAIKKRYDYSEFGKMTESRTLPSQWSSHWRRDVLDVYVAMLFDNKESKENESALTQQLASLWVSSFDGTPSWFADGFGRAVYGMLAGKNDERVRQWDQQIPVIVSNMRNVKELIDRKMNEEDAAIVGYALVRQMMTASGRKPFDNFLRALNKSGAFEPAFNAAVGPLEPSIAAMLTDQ